MQRYVHKEFDFFELFEKLKFETEKYGSIFTTMIFKLKPGSNIHEFEDFLLKYLRISDTVFEYREGKILVVLEETTLRGALILNEGLRSRIKNKGYNYDFNCAAIQGDFIDSDEKLLKSLNKRLEIAIELDTAECVHNLSDN